MISGQSASFWNFRGNCDKLNGISVTDRATH